MAPGRPRVRVGGKQLWCQTCVKDQEAPSGRYRPGTDIAKAAARMGYDGFPESVADRDERLNNPPRPGRREGGHIDDWPHEGDIDNIPNDPNERQAQGWHYCPTHGFTKTHQPDECRAYSADHSDWIRGRDSDPIIQGREHGRAEPFGTRVVPHLKSLESHMAQKIALVEHKTGQRLFVLAHDSGDGQTIYHCPFCGSGQVIARSDKTIECEFCHTSFTVQVQPEYSAFPQTMNGMPVQVPGMPGQIDQPVGGGPMDPAAQAPGGPPAGDADQDGVPDPMDPDANGDGFDDSQQASADNQPPWLKGAFKTASGAELPLTEYFHHLAIKHAGDERPTVLRQVRASRGAS
jgi:hypothetical protein